MFHRAWIGFPILLQGCFFGFRGSEVHHHPPGPPYGVVAANHEPVRTYIPQAARQNYEARTVSWAPGGTEGGMMFLGRRVIVERVLRQDADSNLIARIRLQNTTASFVVAEYRIDFFDEHGQRVISDSDSWTPVMWDPYGRTEVVNAARIRGARMVKLHLREIPTRS
jgi:hypothetical protein